MHPALIIAVMEERDREIARRTKDAWKQPAARSRPRRRRPSARGARTRLGAALARTVAFFG